MNAQDEVAGQALREAIPGGDATEGGGDAHWHAVLASPVRRDALAVLRAAPGPLTATALAEHLDLHVTTVRFHLDQLERVGLVARESEHSGRPGRPAAAYRAVHVDLVLSVHELRVSRSSILIPW